MTARHIQKRLMREYYQHSFILPNYTPSNWFECDLFNVTKAGYFHEFEIKLSASDFRADAGKYKRTWGEGGYTVIHKHKALAAHDKRGPSVFWFVMPADLVKLEQIPPWAGVLWVRSTKDFSRYEVGHPFGMTINVGRRAPRLHRQKLDPAILKHAQGSCYWRYHAILKYPHDREPEYSI